MKKIATARKTTATFLFLLVGLASVAGAAGALRQKLYVLNSVLDTMTVIDVASNQVIGSVKVGLQPHGLAWPKSQNVLWVSAEGEPFPVKYVITSKWMTGAPQFSVQLHDWNSTVSVSEADVTFVPPDGARELEAGAVDELGIAGTE